MTTSDSDDEDSHDLFADPPDFYPPSPKPTTEKHVMLSGQELSLRLVGHNPLWGHHLWQAGRLISSYLESYPQLISSKTVLELGAGAGLPSLVCTLLGAKKVVVTDYPDPDLIENLKYNIEHFQDGTSTPANSAQILDRIVAEGYLWGADPNPLLSHIRDQAPSSHSEEEESGKKIETPKFDVLVLADLLFNHSEHAKLVSTVTQTLSHSQGSNAMVFFTPYRPWLLEKDLAFFDLCRNAGFSVEKVLEERMEKVMFVEDRGDEEVRRTVFGYSVTWESNAEPKMIE